MYNTFLDGTKVAVELCTAANALGIRPDAGGIHLPETDLMGALETFRPTDDNGALTRTGVIDAMVPTGENPSAFVVTRADNTATQLHLAQRYNVPTRNEGQYQIFHRPFHLPQETLVSVASAALDGRPTGTTTTQSTDVVAAAKRHLAPGETIVGGGGTSIYGTVVGRDVADDRELVPFELLAGAEVTRAVATDELVSAADVSLETDTALYHLRQLQQQLL
jgi:Predicted homoserine dehydrogenase